jgi:NitT/TauT family transport system permease protein
MRSAKTFAIILIVHLAVIVLWQVLVDAFQVPKFILPSPLATLATLTSAKYAWVSNLAVTAVEILGGFALGAFVGVTLAVIFCWSPLVSLLLLPLFVTLNMIPKVALGPLFIVWFSYGIFPNILIAFSICFFPILLTTARGLSEVEPDLLDLVKSLRGSRWTLFRKIQLPGSLPYVFSGMKVGAILAVAGAIVGEFIASERGLGYSALFIDHVALAFHAHVMRVYGNAAVPDDLASGGLSPWQLRRVLDFLSAHLSDDPTVGELAQECGLSSGYFTRAFRQTTGVTPHQWLIRKRVERARGLLLGNGLGLADIALVCGFVDQSHFSRVFSKFEGDSPGRWRQRNRKSLLVIGASDI